ncbi:hypothetical protein [Desulfoplanes sp.]
MEYPAGVFLYLRESRTWFFGIPDAPAKSRKSRFRLKNKFYNNLILLKPFNLNLKPARKNVFFAGTSAPE